MKYQIKAIMSSVVAVAALLAIGSSVPASAQFAAFQEGFSGNPFTFTNAGSASTFNAGPTAVDFEFFTPNTYGPTSSPIDAMMTLSSQVSGQAVNSGGVITQGLNNIDVTFTAVSPVNGKSNLLTMSLSSGDLIGIAGGNDPGLTGSTADGNTVDYSSDFMTFGNNNSYDFPMSFSTHDFQIASDGYVKPFQAIGEGLLTSNVSAVPETGSMMTVGMMIAGTGLLCFMKRRNRAHEA